MTLVDRVANNFQLISILTHVCVCEAAADQIEIFCGSCLLCLEHCVLDDWQRVTALLCTWMSMSHKHWRCHRVQSNAFINNDRQVFVLGKSVSSGYGKQGNCHAGVGLCFNKRWVKRENLVSYAFPDDLRLRGRALAIRVKLPNHDFLVSSL